jgi:hypothetical protein
MRFLICCLMLLATCPSQVLAQVPQIQIKINVAQQAEVVPPDIVWRYDDQNPRCAEDDYADVPVRPFMVQGATPSTYKILWFAANSNGYYASESPGAPVPVSQITLDHFKRVPRCARWVEGKSYTHSNPEKYNTGLWMVAPYTLDGVNVYALIHNEFHGEWTGTQGTGNKWCAVQQAGIYLPCDYWNLVAATSGDEGRHFSVIRAQYSWNKPAIALPAPYTPPGQRTVDQPQLPQGMAAQTNMITQGNYAYALVQQFGNAAFMPNDNGGLCLVRAPLHQLASGPWQTWTGQQDKWVNLPASYPTAASPPVCQSMNLPAAFRFTWSDDVGLSPAQLVLIGIDNNAEITSSCQVAADSSAKGSREAFVYMSATADLANGQITVVTPETCLLSINWLDQWGQKFPANTGDAYPSLLDPKSPTLQPGGGVDLNFQFSGLQPYLYAVRLNSYNFQDNQHLYNRDVVRWPLSVTLRPTKQGEGGMQ